MDLFNLRGDYMKDDVQVMYHQVKDNINISSPDGEFVHAMRLNKEGLLQH